MRLFSVSLHFAVGAFQTLFTQNGLYDSAATCGGLLSDPKAQPHESGGVCLCPLEPVAS